MTHSDVPYEGWPILELMGHRRRAGRVREVEQYGVTQLRIDIPAIGEEGEDLGEVTEYYGGSAIYALSPCDEEYGRYVAKGLGDPRPARPRSFVERKALTSPDPELELELDLEELHASYQGADIS